MKDRLLQSDINMYLNKEIIMLYPKIGIKKNGLIMSMLKRANIFASNGYSVTILTVSYDAEINILYQDMICSGILSCKVKIENVYSFYQGNDILKHTNTIKGYSTKSIDEYQVDHKGNFIFHGKGGNKRYEIRRANGTLSYINIFKSGVIEKRFKYDYQQRLSCIQKIHQGVIESVFYFDVNGRLVINSTYRVDNDKVTLDNIVVFDSDGFIKDTFYSEQDFFMYTVSLLFNKPTTLYYFIIDRAIYFSKVLFENKKINYAYVGTIHAAHYNNKKDKSLNVNKNYFEYFNKIKYLDSLIFLTKKQKYEADKIFDCQYISYAVPHVYDKDIVSHPINRKPFSCISVGRFDPIKRIPELVEIFSLVLKEIPEATLSIYGYGSEKNKIIETIEKFNIKNSVFVLDYTEDVDSIYQSADLMLFTSSSEGYGLVIMESLVNGCPVISYDINYGPAEIIKNRDNGVLVKDGDVVSFSKEVITILNDRTKLERMSESASKSTLSYNKNDFMLRWESILIEIETRKQG